MYTCILFSRVDVLDHVEDALGLPNVGVGDDVVLEVDEALCLLEERVRPRHEVDPGGGQQSVVGRQFVREPQPGMSVAYVCNK